MDFKKTRKIESFGINELTIDNLYEIIKTHVKNDRDIVSIYAEELVDNKDLLSEILDKIYVEMNREIEIENKINDEYLKINNIVKLNENYKNSSISTKYGTSVIINSLEKDKDIVLFLLPLERSTNCGYLYNSDDFCEKSIYLRMLYRRNKGCLYNMLELLDKYSLNYENRDEIINKLKYY